MAKRKRIWLAVMAAVLMMVMLTATAAASSIRCKYYQEHGDHEWKQIQNIATTCTKDGYYIYKCSTCSTTKKEVYEEAWQHNWQESENVAATCTSAGYRQIQCSKCGASKKETTDKALGHSWQQTDSLAPTCSAKGYIQYNCLTCGEMKKDTVKALGHNWEKTGGIEPTCTAEGYIMYGCSNTAVGCMETKKTVVAATGHNLKDVRVLKEATCLETGFVQALCRTCGATEVRETPVADHAYDAWYIAKAATDSEMGISAKSCIVCRHTVEEQFYPEGTLYRKVGVAAGVKELQTMLRDCGYLTDRVDGQFGKNTEQAIKDFQTKAKIRVDGIAWPQTIKLLTAEWEKKMGIAPKPTQTPQPGTSEPITGEAEPYCTYTVNADGISEIVYCGAHREMIDADAKMLAEARSEAERLNALRQIRTRWETEMAWLYEEWLYSASEAEKSTVNNANAAFSVYLASQELVWSRWYARMPDFVIERVNALLMMQTADLCAIVHAEQQNGITTPGGCVHIELIDGWYAGAAKGSNSLILYHDDVGGQLIVSDDLKGKTLQQEKQAALQRFPGKQFMDIMIGENVFSYICSSDSMNFVLLAENSSDQVVKVESSGCTIAQAMPLIKKFSIR